MCNWVAAANSFCLPNEKIKRSESFYGQTLNCNSQCPRSKKRRLPCHLLRTVFLLKQPVSCMGRRKDVNFATWRFCLALLSEMHSTPRRPHEMERITLCRCSHSNRVRAATWEMQREEVLLSACHCITRQLRYLRKHIKGIALDTDATVDMLACAFHTFCFPHSSVLKEASGQKEVGPFAWRVCKYLRVCKNIRETTKDKARSRNPFMGYIKDVWEHDCCTACKV